MFNAIKGWFKPPPATVTHVKTNNDGGTYCQGCHREMNHRYPPKRGRDTRTFTHLMCQCGTVTHLYPSLVWINMAYGRYRHVVTQMPKGVNVIFGEYHPRRLSGQDILWHAPECNSFFFFKKGILVQFNAQTLPPCRDGYYRFALLERGRVVVNKGVHYIFNGFSFIPVDKDTSLDEAMVSMTEEDIGINRDRFFSNYPIPYTVDVTQLLVDSATHKGRNT